MLAPNPVACRASGHSRHLATSQRPSRILAACLQEIEPRLHAAANFTVHEPLVQTTKTTLEAYEQRSELR